MFDSMYILRFKVIDQIIKKNCIFLGLFFSASPYFLEFQAIW